MGRLICTYLLYVFRKTRLSKQCRPRSEATDRGVWSGSTLFAILPAILQIFLGIQMDLLKRKKGKRKVQGVPQSQAAAIPKHQEEE